MICFFLGQRDVVSVTFHPFSLHKGQLFSLISLFNLCKRGEDKIILIVEEKLVIELSVSIHLPLSHSDFV